MKRKRYLAFDKTLKYFNIKIIMTKTATKGTATQRMQSLAKSSEPTPNSIRQPAVPDSESGNGPPRAGAGCVLDSVSHHKSK